MASAYEIISPGIPVIDGCTLFRATKVFVVRQGICNTLKMVLRDRNGHPVNLYTLAGMSDPTTDSDTDTNTDAAVHDNLIITVRHREFFAGTVTELDGYIEVPEDGEVSVVLGSTQVEKSGVFVLEWVAIRDEAPVFSVTTYMLVERALQLENNNNGPPTIEEIRQMLLDRDVPDNPQHDALVVSDDQILQALTFPIQAFNSSLPTISCTYNTVNFPWRDRWLGAACGYILYSMSLKMLKNKLPGQASAGIVDEHDKDADYSRVANEAIQSFKIWTSAIKQQQWYDETSAMYHAAPY